MIKLPKALVPFLAAATLGAGCSKSELPKETGLPPTQTQSVDTQALHVKDPASSGGIGSADEQSGLLRQALENINNNVKRISGDLDLNEKEKGEVVLKMLQQVALTAHVKSAASSDSTQEEFMKIVQILSSIAPENSPYSQNPHVLRGIQGVVDVSEATNNDPALSNKDKEQAREETLKSIAVHALRLIFKLTSE